MQTLILSESFARLRQKAYKRMLKLYYDANSGHLGGSFSSLDFLLILYHLVISDEDRFILSKGHAAGAWYTVLWSCGLLTDENLSSFCKDGTVLPGHPSGHGIPGLLFPTGSLGHGPSLSAGLAVALKYKQSSGRVFCLCSEGDWQEGSSWEALNFAVHQKLGNLVIVLDQNKLQAFGSTKEVMGITDHSERFLGFGAFVNTVNGHEPLAILNSLFQSVPDVPTVIILNTIKGYMLHYEGCLESHYLPLSKDDYDFALRQIEERLQL
jgi:transketolase